MGVEKLVWVKERVFWASCFWGYAGVWFWMSLFSFFFMSENGGVRSLIYATFVKQSANVGVILGGGIKL